MTTDPPGATITIDGAYKGTTPLTITDLPVGDSIVELSLEGYETVTETVTITDGQTANLDIVFGAINSDEDSLPDLVEAAFIDQFGIIRSSDPTNIDTDGDGLTDDYEVCTFITDNNGHSFWKVRSNPLKIDSDDDALDDFSEEEFGSNPLRIDSDFDRLSDGLEIQIGTDPTDADTDGDMKGDYEEYMNKYLDPVYAEKLPLNDNVAVREFILGFTKGEWAKDGHDNAYYQLGQFISQVGLVGAGRDAYVCYLHEDGIGTALNTIGAIPISKLSKALEAFSGVNPGLTAKFFALIGKESTTIKTIKNICGDEAVQALKLRAGLADNEIEYLFRRMALNKDSVNDIQCVIKIGSGGENRLIPILVGDSEDGMTHLVGRHIIGDIQVGRDGTTLFPISTPAEWLGKKYPGISTMTKEEWEAEIPNLCKEAIESRYSEWPDLLKTSEYILPSEIGGVKKIKVVINPKTGVTTIYPREGSNVYMWQGNTWVHQPFTG